MLLVLVLFVNTLVFVVLMLHVVEVCVVGVLDRGGDFGGSEESKVERFDSGRVGSTGELDVEAGNGDVDGLRVEGVDGVGNGVAFRIGVEAVFDAVWVCVVIVDGCGE